MSNGCLLTGILIASVVALIMAPPLGVAGLGVWFLCVLCDRAVEGPVAASASEATSWGCGPVFVLLSIVVVGLVVLFLLGAVGGILEGRCPGPGCGF
jgi:hypothetical protein